MRSLYELHLAMGCRTQRSRKQSALPTQMLLSGFDGAKSRCSTLDSLGVHLRHYTIIIHRPGGPRPDFLRYGSSADGHLEQYHFARQCEADFFELVAYGRPVAAIPARDECL